MTHFARVRPVGQWLGVRVLDPAEVEQFDANQAAAINGATGGEWEPTSPIVLGGEGLDVSGPLTAADVQELTITGTLTVSATGTVTVESGGALTCAPGSVVVINTMIAGDPEFVDEVTFSGPTTFVSDAVLTGKLLRHGANARFKKRDPIILGDADHNVDVGADTYIIEMGSTNRTITIFTTSAQTPEEGETVTIIRKAGGTGQLTIRNEAGAVAIGSFIPDSMATPPFDQSLGGSITFAFVDGLWRAIQITGQAETEVGTYS